MLDKKLRPRGVNDFYPLIMLQKPEIDIGFSEPLGSEKDLVLYLDKIIFMTNLVPITTLFI